MASWLEDMANGKVRMPKVDMPNVGADDIGKGVGGIGRLIAGTSSLKSMNGETRQNLQEDLKELGVYNGKADGSMNTKTATDMIRALKAYAMAKSMDPNEAVQIDEGGRNAIVSDELLDTISKDAGIKRTQGKNEELTEPSSQLSSLPVRGKGSDGPALA